MQYMVVERFVQGPRKVYERFRTRGRLAPVGLQYVSSVVSEDGTVCYQLMECDDRTLLDVWMANWSDIVAFDVVPVMSSSQAAEKFG